MTRLELLQLILGQARNNGFQYRRWYAGWLGVPWESARQATESLCEGRRYYALLFSREFAESFWKDGAQMTLQIRPKASRESWRMDRSALSFERHLRAE